jgi:hypothetical protein
LKRLKMAEGTIARIQSTIDSIQRLVKKEGVENVALCAPFRLFTTTTEDRQDLLAALQGECPDLPSSGIIDDLSDAIDGQDELKEVLIELIQNPVAMQAKPRTCASAIEFLGTYVEEAGVQEALQQFVLGNLAAEDSYYVQRAIKILGVEDDKFRQVLSKTLLDSAEDPTLLPFNTRRLIIEVLEPFLEVDAEADQAVRAQIQDESWAASSRGGRGLR